LQKNGISRLSIVETTAGLNKKALLRFNEGTLSSIFKGLRLCNKVQDAKGNNFVKLDGFVIKAEKITKTSSFAKQNCPLLLAFCLFTQPQP